MKRIATLSVLAAAALGAQAQAFVDQARVRSVEPQYETVQVPRQECRSEWVSEAPAAQGPNYAGVAIGAVAGGVLGNQVGKGHGREAATAAGAVVGALAGNHIANRNAPQYPPAHLPEPAIAPPSVFRDPPTSLPPLIALLRTNLLRPPRFTDFAATALPPPLEYTGPFGCCGLAI